MEILLIENVSNLGVRGDVVTVKDGYARNFLLPARRPCPSPPATSARSSSKRSAT